MKPNSDNLTVQYMGETTSKVFSGETESETTKQMYKETPSFFADEIIRRISLNKKYSIADLGSSSGEMMNNLIELLHEYQLETIAVDIDASSLKKNLADKKIVSSVENLPFGSVDIIIMRYVLQWNNFERQKKIIKEIIRVINNFALIEHIGADIYEPDLWRMNMDKIMSGSVISKLKRGEHFLSSSLELEEWMISQNIKFERLRERKIENASNALIERWNLNEQESLSVVEALGKNNYLYQTDWIIFPNN